MTASQYKNIVEWTLGCNQELESADCLTVARKIFNNLGVSFPQDGIENIVNILKTDKYMGWRQYTLEEIKAFADIGVASIAIDSTRLVIVAPDSKICNLSADTEFGKINNPHIRHTDKIEIEDFRDMLFFAYSYRIIELPNQ